MTYYEAQKVIDDQWKELNKYTLHSNPPHIILGCFVSPRQRSFERERYIFIKCIEEGKSNEQLIFELNLGTADLIPFVAILIWNNHILLPLDNYIAGPWSSPK